MYAVGNAVTLQRRASLKSAYPACVPHAGLRTGCRRYRWRKPVGLHAHSLSKGRNMIIKHDAVNLIEFDGLKIFDYTTGQKYSSSLAEISVPVGVRHKRARSKRSDKYYYVAHGHVSFTVDNETAGLSTGDVCIIRQGQCFSYVNNGIENAKLILVHTPGFDLKSEVFEE